MRNNGLCSLGLVGCPLNECVCVCVHTYALTTHLHTDRCSSTKRARGRWHARTHAHWHNSVETNDAHPVNRINYNCMMGNLIVPARVSLMLLDFLFDLFLLSKANLITHQCVSVFPKKKKTQNICNQYECSVNTELAWENYFLLRMFVICFLSLLIVL